MQSQLIILNGTSSAGKSSLARALQAQFEPKVFLHYQMDMFWDMLPPVPLGVQRHFSGKKCALTEAAKAYLNNGFNLIFDTVTLGDEVNQMRAELAAFNPFIVAVKAPLHVVQQREIDRGDRDIGLAEMQFPKVHLNVVYDFEVNTSELTSEEAAVQILAAYDNRLA